MREFFRVRKRFVVLTVIVLVVGIGGYLGVRSYMKLKRPAFYKCLIERYLPAVADSSAATCDLEIDYITNVSDKRTITRVSFVDHPELVVQVIGSWKNKNYWIYSYRTLDLYLEWASYEDGIKYDGSVITQLELEYSNGTSEIVDIGSLCIYGGKPNDVLEAVTAQPLYEDTRIQVYEAKKKLKAAGFSKTTIAALDKMDLLNYCKLNDKAYKEVFKQVPIILNKGDELTMEMKLNSEAAAGIDVFNTNYDCYDIRPCMILYDEEGKEYTVPIHNQTKQFYPKNLTDIVDFLTVRGHKESSSIDDFISTRKYYYLLIVVIMLYIFMGKYNSLKDLSN